MEHLLVRKRHFWVTVWSLVFATLSAVTGEDSLKPVLQTGHLYHVTEVAISSDGKTAATASTGGDAVIWDIATGSVLLRLPTAGTELAFSPDGRTLASADRRQVYWWDLAEGELRGTWTVPEDVSDLDYHPRGDQLAVCLADGYLVLELDEFPKITQGVSSRATVGDRNAYPNYYDQVRFSPDGQMLGVLGLGEVVVYRWPDLEELEAVSKNGSDS